MLKDLPIKPQPVKKSACNKVLVTAIVTFLVCATAIATLLNQRSDLIWAFQHKSEVESAQHNLDQRFYNAIKEYNEDQSRGFVQ